MVCPGYVSIAMIKIHAEATCRGKGFSAYRSQSFCVRAGTQAGTWRQEQKQRLWGEAPPSLPSCHPWQAGELVPRSSEKDSLSYPLPAAELERKVPTPHLSSTVELALDIVLWVSLS